MPIVQPTSPNGIKISAIRAQTKLVIEAAVAQYNSLFAFDFKCRVHKKWRLKLDFGKTVELLRPKNETYIHSWMIGTTALVPEVSQQGDYNFVGGRRVDREVTFSVWGFFDTALKSPDLSLSSQEIAEEESEMIADYFKVNPKLGFDIPAAGLKGVKPFSVENIDDHTFSDGSEVTVAQCSFRVVLAR